MVLKPNNWPTHVPAMLALSTVIITTAANYAITSFRVGQIEIELARESSERTVSVAAYNLWREKSESRMSSLEAHGEDVKNQLDRIESKLDDLARKR